MYVFLDDSGDGGLKLTQGSTRYLVMAACVFKTPADVEQTTCIIDRCRKELRQSERWEFKYSKTPWPMKDLFFETVQSCNFAVRAIIIDKAALTSDFLRSKPSGLKNYAIAQLLSHTFGTVQNAKLTIDGKDSRAFNMADAGYFRRTINQTAPGTIRKVAHADSSKNSLIQLADMVAGAIHRAERTQHQEAANHMRIVLTKARQPEGSIWRFR